MNTCAKRPFLLLVLAGAVGSGLDGQVLAQTFTTLHSFTSVSDGATPASGLILSGNILYGTAEFGGDFGGGTVFKIESNGTGFATLHNFTTESNGFYPRGGLISSGDTFYGTTWNGGSSGGYGTVFAVSTDGTGFTNLHTFDGIEGQNPQAGLILLGNTLYGTALGGSSTYGTVFAVNTDGSGFTNLHTFGGLDGQNPLAGLILSGNTLYGTAPHGGSSGNGTVFRVNTDGTGFTNLYSFTAAIGFPPIITNSDGALPSGALILLGNTLYGTATWGGTLGCGTVFAVKTDGTGFTNIHSFTGSDGAWPHAGLIVSGNTLYGTASGRTGFLDSVLNSISAVFKVTTDGSGFSVLHSFTAVDFSSGTNSDGAVPNGLILSSNTLDGTAQLGGTNGVGTIFSIFIQPQLALIHSGAIVVLTWPTNATGFTLQSTTNLGSSAVWTTSLPTPVVVNGEYTVTNPISGTQEFFRLSQ